MKITKPELEVQTKVVQAAIIDHQQHDAKVNGGEVPEYKKSKRNGCVIM